MSRRRLAYISIVATVGLLAGFGGRVAWSAIPDGNTIHGCYKNDTGVLRVIDPSAGSACSAKSETPLSWSQTGTQGIQGIQGIPGPQGATGSPGPDGVTDYQIVTGSATTAYDGDYKVGLATATAPCPVGKVGTGGGFDLPSDSVSIWDQDGGFAIKGIAGLTVTGQTGVTINAYTVCVRDTFNGG